jgi:hypothetical protein
MNGRPDIGGFVSAVASIWSENSFNPYRDICEFADRADSPYIRTANLVSVLEACIDAERCSLWVARDLGYRGGRRTGVPLTDEVFLHQYGTAIGAPNLKKATSGPIVAERTAQITHGLIRQIGSAVFMWNVFPLHPYEPDNQLTNRKHTSYERKISRFAIEWLLDNLRIDVVVAIGRDAQLALSDMGVDAVPVRHPSYGGQREFIAAVSEVYPMNSSASTQLPLL